MAVKQICTHTPALMLFSVAVTVAGVTHQPERDRSALDRRKLSGRNHVQRLGDEDLAVRHDQTTGVVGWQSVIDRDCGQWRRLSNQSHFEGSQFGWRPSVVLDTDLNSWRLAPNDHWPLSGVRHVNVGAFSHASFSYLDPIDADLNRRQNGQNERQHHDWVSLRVLDKSIPVGLVLFCGWLIALSVADVVNDRWLLALRGVVGIVGLWFGIALLRFGRGVLWLLD